MKADSLLPIGKAVRGWGVIRPSPYQFVGPYRTKAEADEKALAMLAADFAPLTLFQSNQQMNVVAAHERAGVCTRAFLEGYRSHQLP